MPYGNLGLSLKPPKWLRDLGARVLSETTVSVPTPTGIPVTVDLGNPAELAAIRNALLGARVHVGRSSQPTFTERAEEVASGIPWGAVAIGAGALLLLFKMRRGRRA